MRAHPEPIGYHNPLSRPFVQPAPVTAPTVLFVVAEGERAVYLGNSFTRVFAQTPSEAARYIATERPRLVVVDIDEPSIDAVEICSLTSSLTRTSMLVTTANVEKVPPLLKAGCHGVLLKPFSPNLLAARMGRIIKETGRPGAMKSFTPGWSTGTNRVWDEVACPTCGVRGAVSFDFSSYRRMWYACLSCDHTWLGARQE